MKRVINKLKKLVFLYHPLKTLMKERDATPLKNVCFNKKKDKCAVLGNGPSLNEDLESIMASREDIDVICVNSSPMSASFFEIEPEYFALMDTAWWREDPREDELETRTGVYKKLKEVDWKMQLFLPITADLNFIRNQIDNKNIEIVKLKISSVYRPLNKDAFSLYDSGYFGTPFNNVLTFSVFCALKGGYEMIDIYGADFSYLFLIDVDQVTNKVFIKNEHYYGTGEKDLLWEDAGEDSRGSTMYEFMFSSMITFKSHELISEYAQTKDVKIVNRSSYSIIDAYERPSQKHAYYES